MPYANPDQKRAYQAAWIARRRQTWLDGRSCIDCGSTDELHVDHRDPSQKVDHRIWSWAILRRDRELAKCDVRCGDCHRKRHVRYAPHGTISAYSRGCRCDACRGARRQKATRERRARGSNTASPKAPTA